jgi:hypothetical protein
MKRGATIHLGFNGKDRMEGDKHLEELKLRNPGLTWSTLPQRRGKWSALLKAVRELRNYLRYLDPVYEKAPKLRERAESRIPKFLRFLITKTPGLKTPSGIQFLNRVLRAIENIIPSDKTIEKIIQSHNPDLFLITPLVALDVRQIDWLKSAKALGVKTALCVHSWDNLTNKGIIQIEPDLVIVWNNYQKDEAIKLHGIPSSKVAVTGAQCYDKWFDTQPSTTKEEFCRKVGLLPDKPILLYLCSSPFIASSIEVNFVKNWVGNIRQCRYPLLRDAGILIRPHPQNTAPWEEADFSEFENVSVWPRRNINPINKERQAEFFDSIYHSVAVVGINTSALIEAGIVGKPVHTILTPEFSDTQEGTLHFHYLSQGGLLKLSSSLEEHLQQLNDCITRESEEGTRIKKFIEAFVRPHGLKVPCTPIICDVIEELANSNYKPVPEKTSWIVSLILKTLLIILALSLWMFEKTMKRIKRLIEA